MKKIDEKKKRKQNALLNTAYKLFTEKGFSKTSVSDITKDAGVAKGTFYLYFKDKLDLRYKLIAVKAAELFRQAYEDLQKESIDNFEDKIIYMVNHVVDALAANPKLFLLVARHLSWGIFKDSLVEPIDDEQHVIFDVYMKMLNESGHKFKDPEVLMYMIIELTSGCCYNAILQKQPVPVDQLKPYLYDTIRNMIQSQIIDEE